MPLQDIKLLNMMSEESQALNLNATPEHKPKSDGEAWQGADLSGYSVIGLPLILETTK